MSGSQPGRVAIILAAGEGKRMQSDLPKVLHSIGGRPMIQHVVETAIKVGFQRNVIVVGHGDEQVRDQLRGYSVEFVVQARQLGTGHAVETAASHLEGFTGEEIEALENEAREIVKAAHKVGMNAPHPDPASIHDFVVPDPYRSEKSVNLFNSACLKSNLSSARNLRLIIQAAAKQYNYSFPEFRSLIREEKRSALWCAQFRANRTRGLIFLILLFLRVV